MNQLSKEEIEIVREIIKDRKDRKVIMSFLRNKFVVRLLFGLVTVIIITADHFGPQILKFIVSNVAAFFV